MPELKSMFKRPFPVFWFLCLAFISLNPRSTWAVSKTVLDRLEASVNSSLILYSDIQEFRKVLPLRAQLDPLFAGTKVAQEGVKASDHDITNFLIDEELIAQAYPVSDAETEQEINSIQSNNRIDRASLKRALLEQGYTFEQYFKLIRRGSSKRNLIDRDIRTKVNISDDDVKNYFYNHYAKNEPGSHRSYQLQMITISTSSYKTPALANSTAVQALKEIKSGESFEEVAKRFSDDPSASSGGDLGVLTEDQMTPAIREQVKKLQIGEVSGILGSASSGRLFILKLKDVKSLETERLEKMREEIRNRLATAEYQHQIALWLERKRQSAFIHRVGEPAITQYAAH
jgi:peptidyl-prolyl cis-trans isomerase SurA